MQVRPFLCRNTVVAPLLIIALSVSGARGLITAHALRPIATSCSTIAQVRRHQNAGAFWDQPHSWFAGKTTATATRMTAGPGPGTWGWMFVFCFRLCCIFSPDLLQHVFVRIATLQERTALCVYNN